MEKLPTSQRHSTFAERMELIFWCPSIDGLMKWDLVPINEATFWQVQVKLCFNEIFNI